MLRGALSKIDRSASVVLAVVFLVAGCAGIAVGVIHSHLVLLVVSVLVAAWGAAWATVAWRGRLLARLTASRDGGSALAASEQRGQVRGGWSPEAYPSIERTSSGKPRLPAVAARVERWATKPLAIAPDKPAPGELM